MSAAEAQSCDGFGSSPGMLLLDLNLSLQHQEPAAAADGIVDLTKIPSSSSAGELEDGGSKSQSSTLSTLTRKRRHQHPEETTHHLVPASSSCRVDQAASPRCGAGSDEEEELDGDSNSRKKLRLSRDQSLLLEDTFKDHNTLNTRQKQALAKQLGLSVRQVEVWFQNRRARTKLKQTEAECEYMKRNCETLMDHVRRLQKEVNELRSLKLAPRIYMHMPPAATFTLCPSCEKVGIPMAPASAPAAVDCGNVGRIGSVSGNQWASFSNPMMHKQPPF